jgi:uncharacterized protein (DUF885 family)
MRQSRLHRLFAAWWETRMRDCPEWATAVGHPGQNGRWTDRSLEAIRRRQKDLERSWRALAAIPRAGLPEADRLSYDLFKRDLAEAREARRFPEDFLPLSQMSGPQHEIPMTLSIAPAATASDLQDVLQRLEGIPALMDQTLTLLGEGLARGLTPPRITLREVPGQVLNLLPGNALLGPFAGASPRLRAQALRLHLRQVVPALRKLHAFLEGTYLPRARTSLALTALPDGEAWYASLVRRHTTTNLSPAEIHRIGLSEVARIRKAMGKAMAASGFRGGLAAYFRFLRTDRRFFFRRPEDLLSAYRDICKRADPELARLFGTLPRLPYGVLPIPTHAEKSQTTAYYMPGSPEAGRAGHFYANTYDLKSRPRWEMEALSLHEAVPGHHLQIALAQERRDLPSFRKHGGWTATVEGWGLYAEHLGTEMGFYKDPYARFGQLSYEMWRAIRLVVDTGIHALGWTRERAISYFEENVGKTGHDIRVEVDRYIVWPGQALAYKIGELRIKALRARAEKALGGRFDIRAFHDQLLKEGAIPLDLLKARAEDWIRSRRSPGRRPRR